MIGDVIPMQLGENDYADVVVLRKSRASDELSLEYGVAADEVVYLYEVYDLEGGRVLLVIDLPGRVRILEMRRTRGANRFAN